MTFLLAAAAMLVPQTAAPTLDSGAYRLIWDDSVNRELNDNKYCDIQIEVKGGNLSGKFDRLDNRTPKLEGRMDTVTDGSIVVFRQIEDGYICSYQLALIPQPRVSNGKGEAPPVYMGVWQDTKGRSGDFALFKYQ